MVEIEVRHTWTSLDVMPGSGLDGAMPVYSARGVSASSMTALAKMLGLVEGEYVFRVHIEAEEHERAMRNWRRKRRAGQLADGSGFSTL